MAQKTGKDEFSFFLESRTLATTAAAATNERLMAEGCQLPRGERERSREKAEENLKRSGNIFLSFCFAVVSNTKNVNVFYPVCNENPAHEQM